MNLLDLFNAAWKQANLSPTSRALIRLVELCVIAGLVTAVPPALTAMNHQDVNFGNVLATAASTFMMAFIAAFLKYVKAQNDLPLTPDTITVQNTTTQPSLRAAPKPKPQGSSTIHPYTQVPSTNISGTATVPVTTVEIPVVPRADLDLGPNV